MFIGIVRPSTYSSDQRNITEGGCTAGEHAVDEQFVSLDDIVLFDGQCLKTLQYGHTRDDSGIEIRNMRSDGVRERVSVLLVRMKQ